MIYLVIMNICYIHIWFILTSTFFLHVHLSFLKYKFMCFKNSFQKYPLINGAVSVRKKQPEQTRKLKKIGCQNSRTLRDRMSRNSVSDPFLFHSFSHLFLYCLNPSYSVYVNILGCFCWRIQVMWIIEYSCVSLY